MPDLEAEAVPRILRLRIGTYHVPSRYDGQSAREHITGGFELRVTSFNVWDHRPLAISYAFRLRRALPGPFLFHLALHIYGPLSRRLKEAGD